MNVEVEQPAQAPLNKLRCGSRITDDERSQISQYIQFMITRGPAGKSRGLEILSQNKPEMLEQYESELRDEARRKNIPEMVFRKSLEEYRQVWADNEPSMNNDIVGVQQQLPDVIDTIYRMTWRVVKAGASVRFLTSDNPVFFEKVRGLGNPRAEFIFPLSSDVAILGSWQDTKAGLLFVDGKRVLVKRINHRIVRGAYRFLFYHQEFRWVREVLRSGGLG